MNIASLNAFNGLGTHFHLESFGGQVRIKAHASDAHATWNGGDKIHVTLSGPQDRLDAVRFTTSTDGEVTMSDPNAESSGDGVTIRSNGGSISISASGNSHVSSANITINGVKVNASELFNKRPPITAVVRVPIGTEITIDRLYADAEVGDIGGPLTATVSGVSKLKVGCVGTTDVTLSGTGSIVVREVNGDLSGLLSGCGSLTVNGGKVNMLTLATSGTGNATFQGTAQRAKLRASGCGRISVRKVIGRVSKDRSGVGSISVGN